MPRLPLLCVLGCLVSAGPMQAAPAKVDFKRDVYPILSDRCFGCHQGADAKSGVRLDLRAELLGETNGKPLVKPGQSGQSRLIQLVSGTVAGKTMPPKGERLAPGQVALLGAWIDQGVVWDDALLPPTTKSDHWAFQAVKRPDVPQNKNSAWVRNPVDAFVGAGHEAKGLTPAPEAERRILVRRLSLDLTGLPPTETELASALADRSDDWYEKVVDHFLASPHYGERWGRHWLDLARWAESEGYESDHPRPYAWRYRDYVVASFNSDKPYDRFLREQLAGDELEPYSDENLIATGFLASARLSSNEEDKPRQRNDVFVDIVNATGNAVLGLTFNCAQCHNHKFDPITARDYYRFQGFFLKAAPNNLALKDAGLWKAHASARPLEYEPARKLQEALFEAGRARLIAEARKKLSAEQQAALSVPADQRTAEQETLAREADLKFQFTPGRIEKAVADSPDKALYDEVKKKVAAIEKTLPDQPQTFGFYSPASSPTKVDVLPMKGFYPPPYVPAELAKAKPYLLVAGEVHQRGAELDVGWPAVFGTSPRDSIDRRPRTALADWLTSREHPLTARVWVNRLWQHHFGKGIVATPSDFGRRGARPSHSELLDWLASELMASSWSTKKIHRLIVCSNTYRQSARPQAANAKIDPDNLLLWRWPLRRLEVEALRDSMLAVSDELDRKVGGGSDAEEARSVRRTLYLFQKRNKPPNAQKLFDGPTQVNESCAQRNISTVPLQALYLLNNDFTLKRAKVLAQKLRVASTDLDRQIEAAFRCTLGRGPDDVERSAALKFFATHRDVADAKETLALVHFCQALLNLNEFAYLE